MSTLEALRAKADKLATQLRDATANAEAEQTAKDGRNTERTTAFWSDAGDRCQRAHEATVQARAAVVDAAAEGDTLAALEAYPVYVRATVEHVAVAHLARRATAVHVFTEVRQVDPNAPAPTKVNGSYITPRMHAVEVRRPASEGVPAAQYTTVHAPGVPTSAPADAVDFATLLAEGSARLAESHRAAYVAALTGALADQLES